MPWISPLPGTALRHGLAADGMGEAAKGEELGLWEALKRRKRPPDLKLRYFIAGTGSDLEYFGVLQLLGYLLQSISSSRR